MKEAWDGCSSFRVTGDSAELRSPGCACAVLEQTSCRGEERHKEARLRCDGREVTPGDVWLLKS